MRFGNDDLVVDIDRADHQQPHVTDDVSRKLFVRNIITWNIEAESFTAQVATVGEFDREIEPDAFLSASVVIHVFLLDARCTNATPPSTMALLMMSIMLGTSPISIQARVKAIGGTM